jgi:RimJ/RimL family protein N-acetyltransferase
MLDLESQRLLFKRYEENDLPFIQMLVEDPLVMRFIGDGQPKSMQYANELLARMFEQYVNFDVYGLHVLIDKMTGERVGHAGIVAQVIDDAFELEVGYWIAPNYWNNGYGKEAAYALCKYADEELELERYVSAVQVGNTASEKIAYSNGMHIEKVIRMENKEVQIFVKVNPFDHSAYLE